MDGRPQPTPSRSPAPPCVPGAHARTLGILLTLLATLAITTGCGPRESPADRAAREGILIIGNGEDLVDVDPHAVTGIPEHNVIDALTEGLVRLDPRDLTPQPGVAERWEVSPDGRTYTFHLRANARWSNGDPITSTDFLRSHQRILTPTLASQYANMLFVVTNAEAYFKGEITDFSQVGFEAPDERTYRIHLNAPTPYFLGMIGYHYSWYPVHIPTIERFGGLERKGTRWTRPGNFVSNGPFNLHEWRIGRQVVVRKNPLYWDADNVRLNEIRFYPIASLETEEAAFRAGQLHVTYEVPRNKLLGWQNQRPSEVRIDPYLGVYFFRLNVTRPPLQDRRVRQALALSIDRQAIATHVLRDGSLPAHHIVPPGLTGYHPPDSPLRFDPAEARRLLAEAGFPEGRGLQGVELLFNTSEKHRAIAEALQEMWRQHLGFPVTLANTEWKVYLDQQRTLDYDICRAGWIGDYIDPNSFLSLWKTNDGNNNTGWSHPEFDRLLEQASLEADPATRMTLLARAEAIALEEVPIIPLFFYVKPYLIHPAVQNWHGNLHALYGFKEVYMDPGALLDRPR